MNLQLFAVYLRFVLPPKEIFVVRLGFFFFLSCYQAAEEAMERTNINALIRAKLQ